MYSDNNNIKKLNIMTKQGLKLQAEKLAKEESLTFIEACSALQGACAKLGNENLIVVLHELKMESL